MRTLTYLVFLFNLTACSSTKIYNQTDMFIDIEAPKKNVWIGCSDTDLSAENSLMTLYLLADNTTHEFMFRRVSDVDWCLKLEENYNKLIRGAQKVRIVGISPLTKQKEIITDRAPRKFKTSKTKTTWTFIRLSTANGCESYFEEDCKPENYWGGVFPASQTTQK